MTGDRAQAGASSAGDVAGALAAHGGAGEAAVPKSDHEKQEAVRSFAEY